MTACPLATLGNRALQELREQRAAQGFQIKLIFFDVDGTLVNTQREVPPSAIISIERIRAQNIKTAIASGRPPFACGHLFKELHIEDAGMFFTGALLYDPAGKIIIESNRLPGAQAQEFVDAANRHDLHLELYSDTTYFIEQNTVYTDYHASYLKTSPEIARLDSICQTTPIYKALVAAGTEAEKHAVKQLRKAFANLRFYTGHGPDRPDINFISVLDDKACKQRAFARLCDYHNVSAQEVMAIGDAQSDITFLQLAGTGVAMGNASDEVKANADFVTAHVDNDGLALALDSLA